MVGYQKQLQLNYLQMSRRNSVLEEELHQVESELEASLQRNMGENSDSSEARHKSRTKLPAGTATLVFRPTAVVENKTTFL